MGAIEGLLLAAGRKPIESNGSHIRLNGCVVETFHRPHPAKEAKRHQVKDPREFLILIWSEALNAKDYSARIDFDEKDGIFVSHIVGINDVIGFHGGSVKELKMPSTKLLTTMSRHALRAGKNPQKPYSGKVIFRSKPEAHRKAAMATELSSKRPQPVGRRCD